MKDEPKKPYVKPEVTQVPLRPDEAVLGNCKSMTTSRPNAATCSSLMSSTIGS